MERDYNEIFCEAVSTIVGARLNELPYDKTIICTITDDTHRAQGLYTVSDGATTFEAYSDNNTYAKDNQVYVNIPLGDMSQRKHITGRYVKDINDQPVIYVSPLEKVVPLEYITQSNTKYGIAANGAIAEVFLGEKIVKIDTALNDTVAIRAKFQTLFGENKMLSGTYGVRIELYTIKEDQPAGYLYLDSSKDMFGNIYNFTAPLLQQQAYHLNEALGTITKIKWYLYQRLDFTCMNISGSVVKPEFDNNIFVSDIEIYLGADVSRVEDNTVKIYTNDSNTYDSQLNIKKTISLIWYNKTSENQFVSFSDGTFNKTKAVTNPDPLDPNIYYWIEWFIDNQNGVLEKFAEGASTSVECNCLLNLPVTEVSAAVWQNGNKYTPQNSVSFKNVSKADDQTISFLGAQLTLENGANSQDDYPIYGENGHVINENDYLKRRLVELKWTSEKAVITDAFWKDAIITWRIPVASMLRPYDKDVQKNEGESEWVYSYQLTDQYYDIHNNLLPEALSFEYSIAESYNISLVNNKIICEVTFKGESSIAEKNFTFSARGLYGTDYSIVIKPTGNRLFGFMDEITEASINTLFNGVLYDQDGKEMPDRVTLSWDDNTEPSEQNCLQVNMYNCVIGRASVEWAGQTVNLQTKYPVIYSKGGEYAAQVPTTIYYNSFGTLSNLSAGLELKLFDLHTHQEVVGVNWEIVYIRDQGNSSNNSSITDEEKKQLEKYLPRVVENNNKSSLALPATYIETSVCSYLKAVKTKECLWSSPIIIQQYKYESEVLNDWNGALKIDEENNTVLAAAAAFGRKESDNSFSGVVLGEVERKFKINDKITNEQSTGIIGFHHGAQSYGFHDDGTAFIGKSGAGRIYFDGDQGVIASNSWFNATGPIEPNLNSYPASGLRLGMDGTLYLNNTDENGIENHLYFNKNGLNLKTSSINIQLTDKSGGSLQSYINATANSLTSQFRRAATYYCICNTDASNAIKQINIQDFNLGNADNDAEYNVDNITVNDLKQTGVTIAVTFTNAEVTESKTINSDTGIATVERKGRLLQIQIDKDTINSIYFKNAATSYDNPYGWEAGSTVYFTFMQSDNSNGYWLVTDSGSYSHIIQTADALRSEVATIDGNLRTKITQTAESILLEASQTYITERQVDDKIVDVQVDYESKIETSAKNIKQSVSETYTTIEGSQQIVEQLRGEITTSAKNINAEVSQNYLGKEGGSTAFGWNLSSTGFILYNIKDNQRNNVFVCNDQGLAIKGNITMLGGSITWGANGVNAPNIANIPNLETQLNNSNSKADEAAASAAASLQNASNAANDALNAAQSASNAQSSAQQSLDNASAAATSASNAQNNAQQAQNSASTAASRADSAAQSATAAQGSAAQAQNSANEAAKQALAAQQSMNTIVGQYLGAGGGTMLGDRYVVSPYIGGGYLHIVNGSTGHSVTINPTLTSGVTGAIFEVKSANETVIGFDTQGNATFKGVINATGGTFTNGTITMQKQNIIEGTYAPSYEEKKNYTISNLSVAKFTVASWGSGASKTHYKIVRSDIANRKIQVNSASGSYFYILPKLPNGNGQWTCYKRYSTEGGYTIGNDELNDIFAQLDEDSNYTDKNALYLVFVGTPSIATTTDPTTETITNLTIDSTGNITAKSGNIGGFAMNSYSLKGKYNNYITELYSSYPGTANYRIRIGKNSDPEFTVDRAGNVYLQRLFIRNLSQTIELTAAGVRISDDETGTLSQWVTWKTILGI